MGGRRFGTQLSLVGAMAGDKVVYESVPKHEKNEGKWNHDTSFISEDDNDDFEVGATIERNKTK